MQLKTCRDCELMEISSIEDMEIAGCSLTGNVVPHYADPKKMIFHRVPMSCPRGSSEVLKSEVGTDFKESRLPHGAQLKSHGLSVKLND